MGRRSISPLFGTNFISQEIQDVVVFQPQIHFGLLEYNKLITVSPNQTATYYVSQTSNGITCNDSIIIYVNHPDTSYTNITSCDSVEWNGTWYDSSGTYYLNINNSYSLYFDSVSGFNIEVDFTNFNWIRKNGMFLGKKSCWWNEC